jgi:hypothetical protein
VLEIQSKLAEINEQSLRKFNRLIVVGDLHGDYATLSCLLRKANPGKEGILFLGDYADRGPSGVEVIAKLSSLKVQYPDNIFLLKGNHEDYSTEGAPRFYPCTLQSEVEKKKGNWQNYFSSYLKPFFDSLSIAAIIPNRFLFVHGGISSKITSLENLKFPTPNVERDILWSDPSEKRENLNSNRGGAGVEFGTEISLKVLRLLGAKRMIRSHEPQKALRKPFYMHNRRVITISSTSVYGGKPHALSISPNKKPNIHVLNLQSND